MFPRRAFELCGFTGYQTIPWLIIAEAIFSKPAMLAPATRVALHAVLCGGVGGTVVDVDHDVVQALASTSSKVQDRRMAVLAHLQAGGSHAAGVGSLGGGEEEAVALHGTGNGLGGRGHVGALGHGRSSRWHTSSFGGVQASISFWVAQGRAMSQGTVQMPWHALDVLGGGDIVQIGLDAGTLDSP